MSCRNEPRSAVQAGVSLRTGRVHVLADQRSRLTDGDSVNNSAPAEVPRPPSGELSRWGKHCGMGLGCRRCPSGACCSCGRRSDGRTPVRDTPIRRPDRQSGQAKPRRARQGTRAGACPSAPDGGVASPTDGRTPNFDCPLSTRGSSAGQRLGQVAPEDRSYPATSVRQRSTLALAPKLTP